jgi:hypothetical protein
MVECSGVSGSGRAPPRRPSWLTSFLTSILASPPRRETARLQKERGKPRDTRETT